MFNLILHQDNYGNLYVLIKDVFNALSAHKNGKTLTYSNNGKSITISPNGLMTIGGFIEVPQILTVKNGYGGWRETETSTNVILKSIVKKVVIAHGTTKINDYAFAYYKNLEEIILPDGIIEIGSAFFNCKSLSKVNLPKTLKKLTGTTFYNGCPIAHVIVPNGVSEIGQAFRCSSVRKVTLPESIEFIEKEAFTFSSIESINIPKNIKTIGNDAFLRCSRLLDVNLNGYNGDISYSFKDTPFYTKYTFKDVERISLTDLHPTPLITKQQLEFLSGKSFIEQAVNIILNVTETTEHYLYDDEPEVKTYANKKPLNESDKVKKLIVSNGIIVGIIINDKALTIGNSICLYSANDDDGIGSTHVTLTADLSLLV